MLRLTSLVLIVMLTSLCKGEVFTSTDKILDLIERETTLLDALQMHINAEYDNLKALSGFLSERSKAARTVSQEDLKSQAEHPNGAYQLIKLYTRDWKNVLTGNPLLEKHMSYLNDELPTKNDFQGACSALVRLQRVYQLRVHDMYAGNYSGYMGPPLEPDDVYEIGRQAFVDGFLKESQEWLQLAVTELETQAAGPKGSNRYTLARRGQACGLLGRTYYFMNDTERAHEMYKIGSKLDTHSADIQQLERELTDSANTVQYGSSVEDWDRNVTQLCMRGKDHRVDKLKPYHICRFKTGIATVPYVRFKEEILSLSPAVSLFYDVITESEIKALTSFVKGKMFRGLVGMGKNATTAYIRTSDLGWIYDDEMEVAATVGKRVSSMTGLETDQRPPSGPSSSEAFQIVNYGMGGHYDVHMDPFDETPEDLLLEESGERLATFLIYLSDVEKGGNTVFVRSKISVAPQKGMALFWYNFDPKMEKDFSTYHAGCPVVIGQKWIANKWIWTYGNNLRRPCGPTPRSTQSDVEPLMYLRHRHH